MAKLSTTASDFQTWGIKSKRQWAKMDARFRKDLTRCCKNIESHTRMKKIHEISEDYGLSPLLDRLRKAFIAGHVKGLDAELKYSFQAFVVDGGFSNKELARQERIADLRYPIEWYPEARTMQRKVHLHVGPTNSGKTYQALQRLETAESGIYAGPLRLLAHEVYTRLNAKNKSCALITGEERRIPEGREPSLRSCTVEMVPLSIEVDVAVIDEIQMMGDEQRGWAWTQAFLGVRAKEVHLCGESRTVPLVQQLCAMMGDSLEVHNYDRLSPLQVMNKSIKGDLSKLEKGDAIILFSRLAIHAMKQEIEKTTGRRCAVVYGSLPPEVRAQQANLFNDPNNDYDFLVASDAVGMGLNLSIKRIVFEATLKYDNVSLRTLQISEIKQIAGRAGRYRTAAQAISDSLPPPQGASALALPIQEDVAQGDISKTIGLVTTLEDYDMPVLKRAMSSEVPPLATAGILPPEKILARFASYFPASTPFSYILLRLHDIGAVNPLFHLCRYAEQVAIADAIQPYDLTFRDRLAFVSSPANFRDEGIEAVAKAMAKCVAEQSNGDLLNIKEFELEILDEPMNFDDKEYLRRLEVLHKALTLYLWLSYRFAGTFRSQALGFHVKGLVEEKIDACLAHVRMDRFDRKLHEKLRKRVARASMESNTKAEDTGREQGANLSHPVSVLFDASRKKGSIISTPTYVDIGNENGIWQASVSVMCNGAVVKATGTGSSKATAKIHATEEVLQKIAPVSTYMTT